MKIGDACSFHDYLLDRINVLRISHLTLQIAERLRASGLVAKN